jgi:hypothetical protein
MLGFAPASLCLGGVNHSIDLRHEASHERFAICCRRDGNREGLAFLSLSIRRRHTRPSWWRPLGDLSPICRIREGLPALHLLSSSCCSPTPQRRNTVAQGLGARNFPRAIYSLTLEEGSRISHKMPEGILARKCKPILGGGGWLSR